MRRMGCGEGYRHDDQLERHWSGLGKRCSDKDCSTRDEEINYKNVQELRWIGRGHQLQVEEMGKARNWRWLQVTGVDNWKDGGAIQKEPSI